MFFLYNLKGHFLKLKIWKDNTSNKVIGINEIRDFRVHLYPSHKFEVSAFSLSETQALGMPAIVRPLGSAAEKIYNGLVNKKKFEIFFPFTIVFCVKILRILPYRLYFYLWKKIGNF